MLKAVILIGGPQKGKIWYNEVSIFYHTTVCYIVDLAIAAVTAQLRKEARLYFIFNSDD